MEVEVFEEVSQRTELIKQSDINMRDLKRRVNDQEKMVSLGEGELVMSDQRVAELMLYFKQVKMELNHLRIIQHGWKKRVQNLMFALNRPGTSEKESKADMRLQIKDLERAIKAYESYEKPLQLGQSREYEDE